MNKIPPKYHSILICLALTAATVAVFHQVNGFEFVNFDDPLYVYENPNIQRGVTIDSIKWAFSTGYAANWHPLTWLSHIIDWQLFDANPAGHHLMNLVFHIVNTLLLFLVLKKMTDAPWQSAFVAALFALHPLHVESIAWVAERKDVLSTFFWMLTMWAYLGYARHPNVRRYLLVLVSFALGLMAKPMLVTLPFVLLLLDYWPLNRLDPKREKAGPKHSPAYLCIEKIPLFAVALASCIVTFIVQQKGGAMSYGENYSFPVRLANVSISYLRYVMKMVWPSRLAYLYPHPAQGVSFLNAVVSAAILAAATILVLRAAKRRQYLVTGWFWYLGTLVPVIGFVQVGAQAIADRYTYVSLTGLFIIIAWGLPELLGKWPYRKTALGVSALTVLSVLAIVTYLQTRYWKDTITLCEHTLEITENNYMVHLNMMEPLIKQNRIDEAVRHVWQAVRIKPNSPAVRTAMGYALRQAGRLDEAVEEYRKCLQIKPDDAKALNGLGITVGQQGKLDEAVKYFTQALRIDPNFAEAHTNLGFALTSGGKLDAAAVHLSEALRIDPRSAVAHYHLGQLLAQKDKVDQAITHFNEALRLRADWFEPMNALAWYLAVNNETAIHNPDKAVILARQACELTNYERPEILDTLAVAYAAAGTFDKAVETAQEALQLCQSSEQETLGEEIRNRLVLFKAGKPYIESR